MKSHSQIRSLLVALGILGALLLSSGCSAVYVAKPVGEKPAALQPDEWNGTWLGREDSEALVVRVTDAAAGRLEVASVKNKDNKFALETCQAEVRASGDVLFINFRDPENQEERYFWARIKIEKGQAVAWGPDADKFRAWVRAGKLRGRAEEKGDVHLEALPVEKVTELAAKNSEAFEWDEPFMLRRVSK